MNVEKRIYPKWTDYVEKFDLCCCFPNIPAYKNAVARGQNECENCHRVEVLFLVFFHNTLDLSLGMLWSVASILIEKPSKDLQHFVHPYKTIVSS